MPSQEETLFGLLMIAVEALTPFEEFARKLDGPVPAGGSPLYAVIHECRRAREALDAIRDQLTGDVGTDREYLEAARDLGGVTYLNAWVRLMARELGIPVSEDSSDIAEMSKEIIPALNEGVSVGWGISMGDRDFAVKAIDRLTQMVAEGIPD